MIYGDHNAKDDCEDSPGCRPGDICINCNNSWIFHTGWKCRHSTSISTAFSKLPPNERYLTPSMKASLLYPNFGTISAPMLSMDYLGMPRINPPAKVSPTKPITDISDWRAWAHNQPGDCACGINRSQCTYHK